MKGFTLTELAIVIAIIAILACVLIPVFTDIQEAKTQQIIDIYNGPKTVHTNSEGEILTDVTGMELYDVKVIDQVVYMYFK